MLRVSEAGDTIRRTMTRPVISLAARALALALFAAVAACGGGGEKVGSETAEAPRPAAPVDPGVALYNQGKYGDALPLLEASAAKAKTGTLLYQIGFAKGALAGAGGAAVRKPFWIEAKPLLTSEIGTPEGATLERLYYLSVINFDEGEIELMQKYSRQAVDTIEKGGDLNALNGEDWFRLGRVHDFLREPSEAEAAYRRAVAAFRKVPAANPAYEALTLVRVADIDYESRRFDVAANGYEEALKLVPNLDQVKPYRHGVALFGAGRFDEAVAALANDRDAETAPDAQYVADLARKAKDAGGLNIADTDGTPIMGLDPGTLETRIRDAAKEFRTVREKYSVKTGDPLPGEAVQHQKRFVSLLREYLVQNQGVQDFCVKEGIADLVRR
jgi:tetratricopeptide (TPR) repeat protein